jgi:hypothetical protein
MRSMCAKSTTCIHPIIEAKAALVVKVLVAFTFITVCPSAEVSAQETVVPDTAKHVNSTS